MLAELAEALLAVDGEEDGDHHGDEGLVGADVGGGLFAADVLLAGGEGEDEAALAGDVLGLADEAAGHLAEELFLAGDDAAVGAAEGEGDAEGLGFERDDVGLDGGLDDAERDGFGDRDDEEGAFGVGDVGDGGDVFYGSKEVRGLDEDAGGVGGDGFCEGFEVDAAGFAEVRHLFGGNLLMLRVGGDDLAVLGVDGAGDDGGVAAGDADGHHDGFGGAGGAVVHAGVGDLHAGELADHGLELEHGLEGALGDLGLVGGVGGEELAAGDDGVDQDGLVVAIDAGAEEGGVAGGVVGGEGLEGVDDFALGVLARDVEIALELVLGGDGGEEVVDRATPHRWRRACRCGLGGILADSAWNLWKGRWYWRRVSFYLAWQRAIKQRRNAGILRCAQNDKQKWPAYAG